jgi:5-methylcytosine-specific restriction endonuclease McrA
LSGPPDPKSRSLARGTRRYRRKVASPKQWQAIIAAKIGPCRVCMVPRLNGGSSAHEPYPVSFHHVVPKSLGGDDIEDNVVPLCGDGTRGCHGKVESHDPSALLQLCAGLTDAEYAYVIGKLGEDAPARLFRVGRGSA